MAHIRRFAPGKRYDNLDRLIKMVNLNRKDDCLLPNKDGTNEKSSRSSNEESQKRYDQMFEGIETKIPNLLKEARKY